jgi:hypothetical protein
MTRDFIQLTGEISNATFRRSDLLIELDRETSLVDKVDNLNYLFQF